MTKSRWICVALTIGGAGFVVAGDGEPAAKPALFEVERHKDIAYRTDKDADKIRHKLDCTFRRDRRTSRS